MRMTRELEILDNVLTLGSLCSKLHRSFFSSTPLWDPTVNLRADL